MNPQSAPTDAPREFALACHPTENAGLVRRIVAAAHRSGDNRLRLRYRLDGCLDALSIPAAAPPRRGHELWKHTCFEAFVAGGTGPDYYELNFSPSCRWAIYRLAGYRTGLMPVSVAQAPTVSATGDAAVMLIEAQIDLAPLASVAAAAEWRLALSAVIEDAQGRFSHWALAHPAAAPDFHHPDSFRLRLAGGCEAEAVMT